MRGWLKKLLAIVHSDVIPNLSILFRRKKATKTPAGNMVREISPASMHPGNKEDDTRENLDLPRLQSTPATGLGHLCPRLQVIKCTLNFTVGRPFRDLYSPYSLSQAILKLRGQSATLTSIYLQSWTHLD